VTLPAGFSLAKTIGEAAGWVVEHLVLGLYALGIAAAWTAHKVALLGEAFALALVGEGKAAMENLKQFLGIMDDEVANVLRDKLAAYAAALARRRPSGGRRGGGGSGDAERRNRELEALDRARVKSQIEMMKIADDLQRQYSQLELARTEALYKAQLITVEEYYNKKKKLQEEDLRFQIEGLREEMQIKEAQLARTKDEKERAPIMAELARLSEQLTVKTAQLNPVLGQTRGWRARQAAAEGERDGTGRAEGGRDGPQDRPVFANLRRRQRAHPAAGQTRQISELEGERLAQ
jgi:hypothetical protein